MPKNIDNLNFKVILDDQDFNSKVQKDIEAAKNLNVQLSQLLQAKINITKISAQDAANAKRASDIAAKQAIDQERIRKAAELAAAAEEKKRTQAEKTNNEIRRGATESAKAAKEQQRTATEAQRTATAANQAAVNAQRFRTEQQRTATEAQRTATATQNTARATANAQLAQKRLADYSKQTTRQFQTQSRLLNELKGYALGYLSIHGASQLLSSLVRVTGEFELQKTTLAAMLGDLNQAEDIITRIQGLAVESPFQFKELTTYAKQLSAFSVPAEELYDTTKMLADISAGLGVGMDRIVLAYGQVRSAAFLRGQEVRQFTEAGIPILDMLAKQFEELEGRAVSTGEVFDKISARLVPFEMVAKAFKEMTSEGGKFYNMQEVQAETLRGKISNLKDAYEVMLNEIGKGQSENLKGAVDWARRLMQNYEQTGRTLVELVAAYGTYKVALVVATNMQATLARNLVVLRRGFRALTATLSANPYALLAAGITAVGFGIYKASTSLKDYEKIQKAVTDTQKDYTASIASETTKLDSLYAKLRVAKKGTEEYDKAKKAIYTQYASYISELKAEGKEVENLAGIYNDLKDKIEASAKAKYRMTASQSIESEYSSAIDAFYKRFELLSTNMGNTLKRKLMEVEKEALWQYMLGDETALNIPEAEGIRGIAKDMGLNGYGYLIDKAQKDAKIIIDTYTKAKERIDALFGEGAEIDSEDNPFAYNIPDEGEKGKSPAQKAIEEQIRSVQKLQDAYEKLMPYLNEMQMKSTLKAIFPNISEGVIDSLDFRGELERLADELAKFDEDAAQRLRDTIGKDVAGTIADSFKAVEQYKKMLDSWLGEDFNLSGKGVSFDISKIISNLNNEYAKIDQKRAKALDMLNKAQMGDELALAKVREVYGEEVWQKYLANGKAVIDDLASRERAAAKQTADEKIKALADDYVKEQMEKQNISLTDFDDKTIGQIDTIIKRLKGIRSKTQEELNKIYEGGVAEDEIARMEMLMEAIKQLGIIIDDVDVEKEKKIFDNIRDGMGSISDLGKEVESLGDAIGNSELSRLGKDLENTAETFTSLMEAMRAKDTISLISNIVAFVISNIASVITEAYEHQRILTEAALEYADAMDEISRKAHSGIFGTDDLALAAENLRILTEAQKKYQDALKGFGETKFQMFGGSFWRKDSIENTLADFAEDNGWDLYLESGELNIAGLEAYFDAFSSRLTRKQRNLVQNIIDSGKALDDAALQQSEYLTNLFSDVADNIAESMIDAFLESGDAAIDMQNVISDVSRQMVADLIKTMYLMPILEGYKEKFAAIDASTPVGTEENTEQKLQLLETALSQIAGQSDAINETIDRFKDYLEKPEEGTTDLGEGIKGITEDQANLLASYLNAIRADVAYSKALWERMDVNLQRIADMFTSSPTLMEYQAQIAANTYNTAVATQAILDRLTGVIGIGDDGDAIKVIA